MLLTIAIIAAALLALANGANDNFKGVATLYGSGTTNYRRALLWATFTTFVGSIIAWFLAESLLLKFSGKGLVPDTTVADLRFVTTIALAAGLTVLLATRLGFPISTTHALIGAMSGAALASAAAVQWGILTKVFFLPLLASPLAALAVTALLYPILRRVRCSLGVERQTCVCVGAEVVAISMLTPTTAATSVSAAVPLTSSLTATVGTSAVCRERYAGSLLGLEAGRTLDALHFLSAGLVSLARGLNDTPKIAAMMLMTPSFGAPIAIVLCGGLISVGGLVASRRIADSMSHRITTMNAGQGFTANLMTGVLVVFASRWGLPVSTTHVSCGALFGIGLVNRKAHWRFISQVLTAWVTTLPVAFVLSWSIYQMLKLFAGVD